MDDTFTGNLSNRQVKHLFYNAEHDPDVQKMFSMISKQPLPPTKPEVREEAPRIDPFEHIHKRNAELDAVRAHIALQSDSKQILIQNPRPAVSKTETVNLDELPTIVKQSAEAAILRRLTGAKRYKKQ